MKLEQFLTEARMGMTELAQLASDPNIRVGFEAEFRFWDHQTQTDMLHNFLGAGSELHKEAKILSNMIGQRVAVDNTAKATRKYNRWYLVPDLTTDKTFEIISPKMRIQDAVRVIDKVFAFIMLRGETTGSEGLHVTISTEKDQKADSVDLFKLALFLGGESILERFGRRENQQVKSQLEKIEAYIQSRGTRSSRDVANYIRRNRDLTRLGGSISGYLFNSTDKHYSFNASKLLEDGAVEFRMMGNFDYEKRQQEIIRNIYRYAGALVLATTNQREDDYLLLVNRVLHKYVKEKNTIPISTRLAIKAELNQSPRILKMMTDGEVMVEYKGTEIGYIPHGDTPWVLDIIKKMGSDDKSRRKLASALSYGHISQNLLEDVAVIALDDRASHAEKNFLAQALGWMKRYHVNEEYINLARENLGVTLADRHHEWHSTGEEYVMTVEIEDYLNKTARFYWLGLNMTATAIAKELP